MEIIKSVEEKHCLSDAHFLFSSLPSSSRIRIFRMQDPERGQKTLEFRNHNEQEEED